MPKSLHDLRSLVHVAAALAATWGAVTGAWWGDVWLWGPLALFVGVHLLAVQHNHAHVPIFRGRLRNLVVDLATGLVTGFPMVCWRLHHLAGHHAHPWQPADPSSPFRFDGDPALGHDPRREEVDLRTYQRAYSALFLAWSVDRAFRARGRRHRVALAAHVAVVLVAGGLVADAYGPWRVLVVLPALWAASGIFLGAINYYQHWRTATASGEHAAWTFTDRLHNWLNYNVGYHQLHHLHPALHWSKLREVHEADPSYAPADLVEEERYPGYLVPSRSRRWMAEHGRRPRAGGRSRSTVQDGAPAPTVTGPLAGS